MELAELFRGIETAVADVETKKAALMTAKAETDRATVALRKALDDLNAAQSHANLEYQQALDGAQVARRALDAALAGVLPAPDGRVR